MTPFPEDLQAWFWETMDRRGADAIIDIDRLVRDTDPADLAFLGPEACNMIHALLSRHGSPDLCMQADEVLWQLQQHAHLPTQTALLDALETFEGICVHPAQSFAAAPGAPSIPPPSLDDEVMAQFPWAPLG